MVHQIKKDQRSEGLFLVRKLDMDTKMACYISY